MLLALRLGLAQPRSGHKKIKLVRVSLKTALADEVKQTHPHVGIGVTRPNGAFFHL